MEIDGVAEAKRYVDGVKQNVHLMVSSDFVSRAKAQIDLSATSPGFIEMALLDRIVQLVVERGSVFDLIVFDTAPTGHTLQLLRTPKDMTKLVDGLITARRKIVEIDRGSEQSVKEAEEADPVLSALTRRREQLRRLSATLLDHSRTAFVLVTIPEHLPIEETADAARLLEDIGVHVGGLVVNQVEPDVPDVEDGELLGSREVHDYLDRRRSLKTQEQAYLDEIERRFANLPRVRVHKQGHEVYGLASLEVVGREILG
jgi:arsenite-transporting ATPase